MPFFDIICLANSYKHILSRCVAGLRSDGRGWVRPVSATDEGELTQVQSALIGGGQPRLLHTIRVGIVEHRPTPYQPENWLISDERWRLLERPAGTVLAGPIAASVYRGELLFGSRGDRVASAVFDRTPASESLTLVEPAEINFHTNSAGKARVHFRLVNAWYDLALTDPMYTGRVRQLSVSDCPSDEVGIPSGTRLLLTISLTGPFDGYCYKIVAAVIIIPRMWLPFF